MKQMKHSNNGLEIDLRTGAGLPAHVNNLTPAVDQTSNRYA